ncbi:MAG: hypothetical protein H6Q88_3207, partial [Anaeromyxobacteraceae bacterium]|nr:hypothetical protein [Anaeromyxobacteraceae bacterium]
TRGAGLTGGTRRTRGAGLTGGTRRTRGTCGTRRALRARRTPQARGPRCAISPRASPDVPTEEVLALAARRIGTNDPDLAGAVGHAADDDAAPVALLRLRSGHQQGQHHKGDSKCAHPSRPVRTGRSPCLLIRGHSLRLRSQASWSKRASWLVRPSWFLRQAISGPEVRMSGLVRSD